MNRDEELDNFIRSKIIGNNSAEYFAEPSDGFTERVMAKIYRIERKKRIALYFLTILLSLSPFVLREFWMMVRADYFSISGLPLGGLISRIYGFFISPVALYLLLLAGIGISIYYILKLRKADSLIRIA
ncbi:MAG: hypothetical protein WD898_04020 [Candidatus Paceibacterota bacterium]